MVDSFGDGLTSGGADGGYSLSVNGVEIASANNNDYFDSNTYKFGTCGNGPAPTPSPTPASTPSPTPATTSPPVGGGGGPTTCAPITLELITDSYPSEINFFLRTDGEEFLWDEYDFSENQTYNYNACIDPDVCVEFDFYDSFGDGLEAPGKITLAFKGDVIFSGANFGEGYNVRLCNE